MAFQVGLGPLQRLHRGVKTGELVLNLGNNAALSGGKVEKTEDGLIDMVAEGAGFEPAIPVSQDKRLAGARTRPLCDPSQIRMFNIADWRLGYNLRLRNVTVQS